jgi:hypothetical protein
MYLAIARSGDRKSKFFLLTKFGLTQEVPLNTGIPSVNGSKKITLDVVLN